MCPLREVLVYINNIYNICLDLSRCNVVYDYESQQADELTIVPGDIIYVTSKIDEDWWQGNLNGTIGLFPATYVEEEEVYQT